MVVDSPLIRPASRSSRTTEARAPCATGTWRPRHDPIDALANRANRQIVRAMCAIGLANGVNGLITTAAGDGDGTALAIAAAWLCFWCAATARPDITRKLLMAQPAGLLVVAGGFAAASIAATGGPSSPMRWNANALAFLAVVALTPKAAAAMGVGLATAVGAGFTVAYASSSAMRQQTSTYIVLTDVLDPLITVLGGLVVVGAFQTLMRQLPAELAAVRSGGVCRSAAMTRLLTTERLALPAHGTKPSGSHSAGGRVEPAHELSPIEHAIVRLVRDGLTPQEAAVTLGLAPERVYALLRSAKAKLGARTIAHLVRLSWDEPS